MQITIGPEVLVNGAVGLEDLRQPYGGFGSYGHCETPADVRRLLCRPRFDRMT